MPRKMSCKIPFLNAGVPALRDNEVYRVSDDETLDNLVVSETILRPNKNTNGHKHDGLDEVYIFTKGNGYIEIDEERIDIEDGDIVQVKGGEFHKVFNTSNIENLVFVAVFQKYTREDKK